MSSSTASGAPAGAEALASARPEDYGRVLSEGRAAAAVWGLGNIGGGTFLHLLEAGIGAVGYDISPAKAAEARARVPEEADERAAVAETLDDVFRPDVLVHFVAVPTERDGKPWMEAAVTVFREIARRAPGAPARPLVVVESTLTPGTTDAELLPFVRELGAELLVAVAPRRDWGYGTLRSLDRVFGGIDEASADAAEGVLATLCDKLHRAPDHRYAELAKCIENAYRHVEITLANQLSLAFPDVDVKEALRLAATKWNMGLFQPGFGAGGCCIPLASSYLLEGAPEPEELSLLLQTIETDTRMRDLVADAVADRGFTSAAVLGLAYRDGMKMATQSPTLKIVERLRERGVRVGVLDPLYSDEEVRETTGAEPLRSLEDAARFEAVLLVTPHPELLDEEAATALRAPGSAVRLILDNPGAWSALEWPEGIEYRFAGSPQWLQT